MSFACLRFPKDCNDKISRRKGHKPVTVSTGEMQVPEFETIVFSRQDESKL